MSEAVRFIRKNGKIIPIGAAATGAGAVANSSVHHVARAARAGVAVAGAAAIHKTGIKNKNPNIKVNKGLDLAGLGLSIASGAFAAATFSTPAGLGAGFVGSHALDAVGISANVGSVSGRGHGKARAIQGAKQEARNFAIGNAVFAAGILGVEKNRTAAVKYAKKGIEYSQKVMAVARKALGVV